MNAPVGLNEFGQSWVSSDLLAEGRACGIIVIDDKEKITTLTREAAQLLGWENEPSCPQDLDVLPPPLRSLAAELRASGHPPADRRLNLMTDGRPPLVLRVHAVPLRQAQAFAGIVLVLSDFSQREQREQRLLQLARLADIGTLATGMAHEIKNALVASRTFVDLLLEKHEDAELVEIVRRELSRIDSLVVQTLRFARSSKPRFTSQRLHDILSHSLRLVQPQLDAKLISLNRSFGASPDLVNGDDHQLQQAFVNLLLNASEAMGPHGTLTIATTLVPPPIVPSSSSDCASATQLRVTIQDTGAGIPPDTMPHLFEPFFTTKPNGTGLGLPITWRIIQDHHGSITVDSQPGQGTVFSVLLPGLRVLA